MDINKKKWSYTLIVMLLLIVTAFCIQSTFAYFTDTDTIGSNIVSVPYTTKTVKLNDDNVELNNDIYEITSTVGDNAVTLNVSSNYPVVVRFDHTQLEKSSNVTYNNKFSLANDGYYYYNELVSSGTINLFSFTATESEDFALVIDVVQGDYYGLGAMIGYVKDSTGEQGVSYSKVDFINKTFTYNVRKSEVGNKIVVVGYGKTLEEVTESKTITITVYSNITFKVMINFTA